MPHPIQTDPAETLSLEIDYQSVHVVGYALRYREPDGSWEDIGQGSTADGETAFDLPALPWGTEIQYRFVYSDEGEPFRADLVFSQADEEVAGSPVEVEGGDDDEGVTEGTVVCVDELDEDEEDES